MRLSPHTQAQQRVKRPGEVELFYMVAGDVMCKNVLSKGAKLIVRISGSFIGVVVVIILSFRHYSYRKATLRILKQ